MVVAPTYGQLQYTSYHFDKLV